MTTSRSSARPSRGRRSSRLLLAASALALASSTLLASPAQAHWDLVDAVPSAGSSVEVLPDEVSLTFSGDIAQATVFVLDESCRALDALPADDAAVFTGLTEADVADCTNHATGDAVLSGPTVTQPVTTDSAPGGAYVVLASVVYSDTHPEGWMVRFDAETSAASPSPSPVPETSAPAESPEPMMTTMATEPAESGDDSGASPSALPWALGGIAVAAGAAAAAIVLVVRARRRP